MKQSNGTHDDIQKECRRAVIVLVTWTPQGFNN